MVNKNKKPVKKSKYTDNCLDALRSPFDILGDYSQAIEGSAK